MGIIDFIIFGFFGIFGISVLLSLYFIFKLDIIPIIMNAIKNKTGNKNNKESFIGKEHQLARKFVNKYKTINNAKIFLSSNLSGYIFYDKNKKLILHEDDLEDAIPNENLDKKEYILYTRKMIFDGLNDTFPNDDILKVVYDNLVKYDNKNSMDIYCINSIVVGNEIIKYKEEPFVTITIRIGGIKLW